MAIKRFVTVLIFSLAITSISLAQKSAQATMKVQVRVVEGNAITQQAGAHSFDVNKMASGSGISELTSMRFKNSGSCQTALDKPEMLHLQNEEGEVLSIPISYLETTTTGGSLIKINAGWSLGKTQPKKKGIYRGELVTSVAYQ